MRPSDDYMKQFDEAYWLSFPPEVQALKGMTDPNERLLRAIELSLKGLNIDPEIQAGDCTPSHTMYNRTMQGYVWYWAVGGKPTLPPGVGQPQSDRDWYDPNNPPNRSVKVSMKIEDFPPYNQKPPEGPVDPMKYIGAYFAPGKFWQASGTGSEEFPIGYKLFTEKGVFIKSKMGDNPMGPTGVHWALQNE